MTIMKPEYSTFKASLKANMAAKLPGVPSQMKMVPAIRKKEIEKGRWKKNARKAAVLICFYPDGDGKIHFVLIRRNEYDGVHSGQISFPGGKYEDGDRDIIHTALREAEEETNILEDRVEVIGEITPVYIPPSNFLVQPVIGWTHNQPDFIPDKAEVSEILSISLSDLLDPGYRQLKNIHHREFNVIDVPCFYIQGHIIWGATAMMLSEVVDIIGSGYQVQGAGDF